MSQPRKQGLKVTYSVETYVRSPTSGRRTLAYLGIDHPTEQAARAVFNTRVQQFGKMRGHLIQLFRYRDSLNQAHVEKTLIDQHPEDA